MKSLLAAAAILAAAVSFEVGMRMREADAHVAPAAVSYVPMVAPVALASASHGTPRPTRPVRSRRATPPTYTRAQLDALNDVLDAYCIDCHSNDLKLGNLSLEGFDIGQADTARVKAEKMIRKLRAEMMPLAGRPRPASDTLQMVANAIERVIDKASPPNAGSRTFQRLNRPEYENAVRDLLGVDINAADYLPLDTKSANFDNIADAQLLSPTLLEAYLNAAATVSLLAVGDKDAPTTLTTYRVSPYISQHPWDHVEGAPYGTRGGVVAQHTFVADGRYELRFNVAGGVGTQLEDIDVSIDGERVALLKYERGVNKSFSMQDLPLGVDLYKTESLNVTAGPHRVSVAFVKRTDGPYEDLIKPHDWSLASGGSASSGTTMPPHIMDLGIVGPQDAVGVSETPSRRIIFSCRPSATLADTSCARQIVTRLGTRAYRRELTSHDVSGLMTFYTRGAEKSGFEEGVRSALQAMLASPYFVFRFETTPDNATPGKDYKLSDYELASRLSFFLWSSIPDDRLLKLAATGRLSQPVTLHTEVKRMLADSRADALATRFAGQWLRLQDIEKVRPDVFWFPDYDEQLGQAMRKETELFFGDIVRHDRSILTMLTANYTFVNERLARHYGFRNISGEQFRRVTYPDSNRRGILGQGSMLVQTSLANRTSPVLRGKWVMEVVIGMPPPPPPPNVPSLDETTDGKDGKPLTTRERMELHRKNITCRTCHQYMDPIGLALDNFDVTGRWRYRENAMPLDTQGQLYDGTPVSTPAELTGALLKRPTPFVRHFTENLMAYALGRRVADEDQPAVRAIAQRGTETGYRFSSFVMGVVNSTAFRMRTAEQPVAADDNRLQR
jgi:uncharacterized protein DUF1592/uncharacterized protein DUF1588/uncharacterized protein DUF1587/uncharacterized protein DUF1585/uncharacterized protein DUF1595